VSAVPTGLRERCTDLPPLTTNVDEVVGDTTPPFANRVATAEFQDASVGLICDIQDMCVIKEIVLAAPGF